MSERRKPDKILEAARAKATNNANPKHIFGDSYNVKVESGQVILKRKSS